MAVLVVLGRGTAGREQRKEGEQELVHDREGKIPARQATFVRSRPSRDHVPRTAPACPARLHAGPCPAGHAAGALPGQQLHRRQQPAGAGGGTGGQRGARAGAPGRDPRRTHAGRAQHQSYLAGPDHAGRLGLRGAAGAEPAPHHPLLPGELDVPRRAAATGQHPPVRSVRERALLPDVGAALRRHAVRWWHGALQPGLHGLRPHAGFADRRLPGHRQRTARAGGPRGRGLAPCVAGHHAGAAHRGQQPPERGGHLPGGLHLPCRAVG